MMSSNDVLRMTDTRRLSPQTTSSSGYHSDLSSNNQSPQSIHDQHSRQITDKQSPTKSFARLSCFLRKQYEKAKVKFLFTKPRPFPPIETCSKSTSTTALTNPTELHPAQTSTKIYQRSSFIEPVHEKLSFDHHHLRSLFRLNRSMFQLFVINNQQTNKSILPVV